MKLEYAHLIPEDFHSSSKVWIYQSNRLFLKSEVLQIEELLTGFVSGWKSHGVPVKGYGNLLFGQFIILMTDETVTGISGCSTDSSVHLIKKLEKLFAVDLFNRQLLAFIIKDKIQLLPLAQLQYAVKNNFINNDLLYFNNLIADKDELLNNWIIPVEKSWLSSKISAGHSV